MDIKHKETEADGRFYVEENGAEIASITYNKAGSSKIVIKSTDTDPAYRGRGIAKALVERLAEFAVENELEVIPVCSYAKKVLERNPELLQPKSK